MNALLNRVNIKKLLPYAIIFSVFMLINLSIFEKFDDYAFTQSFKAHNSNIINWCIFYWNNWSSRVLPHGLAVMLMSNGYTFFRIVNAIMQTSLVFIMGSYSTGFSKSKNKLIFTIAAFFAFLYFIPYEVHTESDFWQIASVLYLWAGVMALFCMKPFWKKLYHQNITHSKLYCVCAVLAAIYAAGYEQTAPLIITFGIITELYCKFIKKQSFSKLNLTIIGVTLAVFLLCLTAPGNAVRTNSEIIGVLGFYPTLSFIDKGFWGFIASVKMIVENYTAIMLVLSIVILLYTFKSKLTNTINKIFCLIPCIYFGLLSVLKYMQIAFLGQELPYNIDFKLYNIIPPASFNISYSFEQWLSTSLAVFVCILLGALIFTAVKHSIGFAPALLYSAAFALIAVIGFTPSGLFCNLRIAFIPGILLIIVTLNLINNYNTMSEVKNAEK